MTNRGKGMSIGSSFEKMAVQRLRNDARTIAAHLGNGSGSVSGCAAHGDIAAGLKISLEMLDVLIEATTSQTKTAVLAASVGSGIGVAAGAFVVALLKSFSGGG
jgi:hypothetical protein